MKLSQFEYTLPLSLVAQYPVANREDARMLVVDRATGEMELSKVTDLLKYFTERDVMVVNNSKVFPAKINGRKEKTGDNIQVFLQRELVEQQYLWDTIVEPARKIRTGNKLFFGKNEELVAEVIDNTHSRGRTIKFFWDKSYAEFREKIEQLGELPLPKYIKRKPTDLDKERYNSIFARKAGAVVACGASLHFSETLVRYLEVEGIEFAELTVHNSLAANRIIEVEDLAKAKAESDAFEISETDANMINRAIGRKKKICAVGVMVMRVLEANYDATAVLRPAKNAWTHLNIHPPFDFQITNALLTNFHVPKTYPFTATCAFGGYDLVRKAYDIAIKERMRFLVYGDAMLIL